MKVVAGLFALLLNIYFVLVVALEDIELVLLFFVATFYKILIVSLVFQTQYEFVISTSEMP